MPFSQINVNKEIIDKKAETSGFADAWDRSRNEYQLIHEVVRIRKELNLTQTQLAELSDSTQQEISRLEKREHSPALKTLCRIVNAMGYELVLRKR